MKLAIDMQGCQSVSSGNRGVGRYVRELTKHLITCSKDELEIFLVLNGNLNCTDTIKYFENYIDREHIKVWYNYNSYGPAHNSEEEDKIKSAEYFKEWYFHQLKVDAIWIPNYQEGLTEANIATSSKLTKGNEVIISTLHDVTPLLFPDVFLREDIKKWYDEKIDYVKNSDIILTVSNFSKEKITELLKIDKNIIHAIYNGYDKDLFYPNKNFIDSNNKEHYFLYAGGSGHQKNIKSLLVAYSKLKEDERNNYHLKFVGKDWTDNKDQLLKDFSDLGIKENQIELLGFVSDEELRNLLQKCVGFIFPSYAEGFGLPAVEAMACGAPTIVANATSLKELVINKEALFEPFDTADITNKMKKLIYDKDYANRLIEAGLKRVNDFSWSKSAEELKKLILKQRKPNDVINYSRQDLCDDIIKIIKPNDFKSKINIAKSIEQNTIYKSKNIYVDVSAVVLNDYVTGIQRSVNGIIEGIKGVLINNDDISINAIYSNPSTNNFYYAKHNGDKYVVQNNQSNTMVNFHDGDILLMPDLHPRNTIAKKDYLQNLSIRGIKVITILYDLIPIEHPNFYQQEFVNEYNEYLRIISTFSGVISISKTTMEAYESWCKNNNICFPPYFINDYFYLGSDFKTTRNSTGMPETGIDILNKLKSTPTILMVGTIEPRKMHQKVLMAFEYLWNQEKDYQLVFVGRAGWKMDDFINYMNNHPENGKRFHWLSQISDEYLDNVYENSDGIIVASIQEGFGLPIIEAAHHNKPLLVRDIPIFKEIAKDGAEYFNDDRPEILSNIIDKWILKIKSGDEKKSSIIKNISWKESSKTLLSKIDTKIYSNLHK